MIAIELGVFYIANVLHNGKIIHVEGVAEDFDEQTVLLAPSPSFFCPQPAKVRVYREQIVYLG